MLVYCKEKYGFLLAELRQHKSEGLPLKEEIVRCFGSSYGCWSAVARQLRTYRFADRPEEILFFKEVKPAFMFLVEYYQLMYHGVIFQPEHSLKKLRAFWQMEHRRYPDFIAAHACFCQYYTSGRTEHDPVFFTRCRDAFLGPEPLCSTHDHLVSRYRALKKYDRYVTARLKWLAIGR